MAFKEWLPYIESFILSVLLPCLYLLLKWMFDFRSIQSIHKTQLAGLEKWRMEHERDTKDEKELLTDVRISMSTLATKIEDLGNRMDRLAEEVRRANGGRRNPSPNPNL